MRDLAAGRERRHLAGPVNDAVGIASASPAPRAVPSGLAAIQKLLLRWYEANARDLPWRRTRDPYAILVSEVMLQQTQVDRVIPKYVEFLERFPSLSALAEATPAEVIRAWAPLGYNRRAVNLHRLAVEVVDRHGGRVPSDLKALLQLPGIGPYTAAAVACFAFGYQEAVVDTNVRRVLTRLDGCAPGGEAGIRALAQAYLPDGRAAEWNQALMDLGATLCRAATPRCLLCPVRDLCPSRGTVIREARAAFTTTKPEAFRGSNRYLRGRIVDLLRERGSVSVETVASSLGLETHDTGERLRSLLAALGRDGLITVDAKDAATVSLPT